MNLGELRVAAFERMCNRLRDNPYPGRVVFVGTSTDGKYAVQGTATMGRGKDSRNRVYERDGSRVFTQAADPSSMTPEAAKNIIYTAMLEQDGMCLASNGNQTDSAMIKLSRSSFGDALLDRTYEDDAPNFTPRITGLCEVSNGTYCARLHIIRKSELTLEQTSQGDCEHFTFDYGHIVPGFGFCISTYMSDGKPLPSYDGVPFRVLIDGELEDVATNYWQLLNPDNRVSLAVKFINLATGKSDIVLRNKYAKVTPLQPQT